MPRKRARPANTPPPPPPPERKGPAREWFFYFINGRTSKYAHSLAVYWTCKEDGQGIASCGINPYDYAPDVEDGALTVGFQPADDAAPRCPACLVALEAPKDIAA